MITPELSKVDWSRVLKFLGGGALVGGGVASAVALYKFLNRLNDKRDSATNTSYDDDVMYLNLGEREKQASVKEAGSDTALMSYVAAALAGYLGYKGVDAIFNKIRGNQLQEELDQAQQIYINRVQGESKIASTKKAFSGLDNMGAFALGIPLLVALASGVITNKILTKGRPSLARKGKRNKVRKLVIRKNPPSEKIEDKNNNGIPDDEEQGEYLEEENLEPSPEDIEGMVRATMAKESRAIDSGFDDLVTKVANGGLEEFKQNLREYGFNTALDMIKGARLEKASNLKKNMATSLICHDSLIFAPLSIAVASEYHDMGPGICKAAASIEEPLAAGLIYLSRQFFKKANADIYKPFIERLGAHYDLSSLDETMLKSAVSFHDVGLLNMLLRDNPDSEEEEDNDVFENASTLQVSRSEDSTEKDIALVDEPEEGHPTTEVDSEEARQFLNKHEDAIDSMFESSGQLSKMAVK